MSWVVRELIGAELGDVRRTERLVRIVEALADKPEAGLPQACEGKAMTKGAYRFFGNKAVSPDAILQPHRERTAQRASEHPVVLVAQDTTEIDLTAHPATEGLGYLACANSRGLLLHNLLCISPDGVPLGVIDQTAWMRPPEELGKRVTRNRRRTEEKESQRWLDGLASVQRHLKTHPCVVLIGDRESDLFDLFASPRRPSTELLVRVRDRKRRVDHPDKHLGAAVAKSPRRAEVCVEVPRADDRPRRTATLTLRWIRLTIRRPANHLGPMPAKPVELTILEAREEHPPAGATGLVWLLATTLPIAKLDDALRILKWYTFRWLIERLHFVLKSGCGAERHQLATAERQTRLLTTLTIVAWRTLTVMYEARRDPDARCTRVFSEDEWRVLHWSRRRKEPLPSHPPTIRQALRDVACLGGFLGRRRDGEPGVRTIWRGLRRLADLTTGYRLGKTESNAISEDCG